MEIIKNKLFRSTLIFTFLIALFISCSNQSHSNQKTKTIQLNDNAKSIENRSDTTLLLKFKFGVRSILEDSKGNIWFGSDREGVGLFDGKKLTYFTSTGGLSSNQVRSIFEDSNGIIWFECGLGISSYDGRKMTTHNAFTMNYNFKNEWQSGKNDLWFKGNEIIGYNEMEGRPGVYRYDGNKLSYHIFPLSPKENENNLYSVSTPLIKGKNRMFWFGTYGAVIGYDGTSFTVIDDKSLGLTEETGYLHIRSIFEDSKGNLWIGNNGIGVLLNDGDSTVNFSEFHGLVSENSLHTGGYISPPGSLEHVFSIGEDEDGNMWFGDRDTGAWRFDGKSFKNFTTKDGLTTTHIWQIYKSKTGEMWFAMGDGSVCKFNGESFDRIF